MLEKYPDQVNLVNKHYPLRSHKFARPAAIASFAAARQGKYKAVSKALYQAYNKLNDEKIRQIVVDAGLDMERYDHDIKDPLITRQINADVQLARSMKVRGVPAIYINGRAVRSRTVQGMSDQIEEELRRK